MRRFQIQRLFPFGAYASVPPSSNLSTFTLNPFDIPHILDLILSHLDSKTRHSCLLVNKTWFAATAPMVWEKCFVGWGWKGPSWGFMINNIQHVNNLIWCLSCSRERCRQEIDQLSAALQRSDIKTCRLQEMFIRGQDVLRESIEALLPAMPQLRRLTIAHKDKKNQRVLDVIPLEAIITNLVHLKELRLASYARVRIYEVDNNASSNPTLGMGSGLAFKPSLSLRIVDFGKMDMTAQQIVDIAPWFPRLETLMLDCISLFDSIAEYQSLTTNLVLSDSANTSNEQSRSRVFARDFSSAWPTLTGFTLHLDEPITHLRVATPTETSIFTRDLVAALVHRLRILNLPTAIMDYNVFDVMLDVFSTAVDNLHSERAMAQRRRTFLSDSSLTTNMPLEQVRVNGFNQGVYDKMASGRALLRFLENNTALRVLDLGNMHIGSVILERPEPLNSWEVNSGDIVSQENHVTLPPNSPTLSPPLSPSLPTHPPPKASYYFLGRAAWACKNLQYLHLNGAHTEQCTPVRLHSHSEDFELSREIFRQISKLTRLRFLWLQGFVFSEDLEKSGFHQLATLQDLRVISVDLHWAHRLTDTQRLKDSSPDTMVGFVGRSDIKWMVESWPRLENLNLGGPCICTGGRKHKIQGWLNDSAGPGRVVTIKEGYDVYSKRFRLDD
ncbi:hypothetical protein BGX26_008972 [Mortierella sp. AD094]|nr:hypothetical protein BGX26_008972 [Mortierella sp. AD094]